MKYPIFIKHTILSHDAILLADVVFYLLEISFGDNTVEFKGEGFGVFPVIVQRLNSPQ